MDCSPASCEGSTPPATSAPLALALLPANGSAGSTAALAGRAEVSSGLDEGSGAPLRIGPEAMAEAKIKAREWQMQLRLEEKLLEKEIQRVKNEEAKLQRKIAAQAHQGSAQDVQLLAHSIVRSRKAVASLESTKSSMHAA